MSLLDGFACSVTLEVCGMVAVLKLSERLQLLFPFGIGPHSIASALAQVLSLLWKQSDRQPSPPAALET